MPHLAGFVEGLQLSVLPGCAVEVGQQLVIGVDEERRPALFNCDTEEACLVDAPPPPAAAAAASKAPPSLLQAALQCVLKERISCYGQVTAVEGDTAIVRLALVLPDSIWAGRHRWAASPAAALLFTHLAALPQPCDGDGDQGQEQQQQQQYVSYLQRLQRQLDGVRPPPEGPDPFSLAACFQAQPMRGEHTVLPPLVAADPAQPCPLAQLDQPLLLSVLSSLDRRSLVAAAATCRHLRELTRDVAPALKLSLFPHQRIAVMWMQGREAAGAALAQQQAGGEAAAHPFVHAICCSELKADSATAAFGEPAGPGLPLWLDTASGEVLTEPPPALRSVRGGLFTDEPGLGKTITALALILRTLGTLPAAPDGLEVTRTQPGRSYYALPRAEVASAAQMTRSRSSRASLRRTRSSGPAVSNPASEEEVAGLLVPRELRDPSDPVEIARHIKRQRRSASAEAEAAAAAAAAVRPAMAAGQAAAAVEGGAGAAAAEAKDDGQAAAGPATETWAQCELCEKWRRLPPGHKAPSGDFVCAMNPDEALQWQGCNAPEQEWLGGEGGDRVLFCPGWVKEGAQQGAEHNVAFYRRLLQQHPYLTDRASPLVWLARQRLHTIMSKPFTLETERCRDWPGFSAAFRQMELEPVLPQTAQRRAPSQQQGGGRGRGRGVAGGRGGGRGRGIDSAGSRGGEGRGTTGTAGASEGSHGEGLSSGSDDVPVLGRARGGSDDEQAAGIAAAGIAAAVKQRGKRSQVRLYTFGSSSEEGDEERQEESSSEEESSEEESSESDFSSGEEYAPKRPRPAAWLEDNADDSGSSSSGGEEEEEASSGEEAAPAARRQQQQVRWQGQRRGQGPGRGRGGGRGASSSAAEPARWRRPASHAGLALDQEALWQALEEELVPPPHRIFMSPATLVVVPAELIDHWRTQIRLHVQAPPGQLSGLRVLVYTAEEREAARRAGQELTPQRLAWEADIVLTTFDTMSSEWRPKQPIECSPLMQVHWQRVILDEGHKVGGSTMTNKLQMAVCVHADCRWVMTGTPTPNTPDAGVDKLQPLLAFLQHQPYGSEAETWKRVVQAPFERREEAGRLRLLALLNQIMIRASKADLVNLGIPPLVVKEVLLDFTPEHANSHNLFVDIVRFNLMTSDWYDDSHCESLLNAANAKRAQQTLNNLRLSCNVAGNCVLQVLPSDVEETLQLLTMRQQEEQGREVPCSPTAGTAGAAGTAGTAGPSNAATAVPAHKHEQQQALAPLPRLLEAAGREWAARAAHIRACLEEGGACDRCSAVVRVLCVTPCACLLCVDCASSCRTECPKCASPYRMQPVDDPGRLADNPHPKWEVPLELIEWQPAYAQRGAKGVQEGTWQEEWRSTRSTKCVHLLRRLLEIGAAVPPGSGRPVKNKAIVYTQFWSHMQLLEFYLRRHGLRPAVLKRGMSSQAKQDALSLFRHSPHVGVLLMDRSGQVGLDLSFASHVFLMEPIFNGADEEQVISRAHRMGAKQPVQVEILAMRGTVEERMLLAQQREGRRPANGAAPLPGPALAAAAAGPAAGRQAKGDAGRREERNEFLRLLRPVPMADLPAFEDLPGGEDEAAEAANEERRRAAAAVAAQLQQAEQEGREELKEVEEEPVAGKSSQARKGGSAVAAAIAAEAAAVDRGGEGAESSAAAAARSAAAKRPAASPARARQPTWPEVASGAALQPLVPAASYKRAKPAAGEGSAGSAGAAPAAAPSAASGRRTTGSLMVRLAVQQEKEEQRRQLGAHRQQQQQQQQGPQQPGPPAVKQEQQEQQEQRPQQAQQVQQQRQPAQCMQSDHAAVASAPPAIKQEPEQEAHHAAQPSPLPWQPPKRPAAADAAAAAAGGRSACIEGGASPGEGRPSKRRRAVRFADEECSPDSADVAQQAKEAGQRSPQAPSRQSQPPPPPPEQQQQQRQQDERQGQQQEQQAELRLAAQAATAAHGAVVPAAAAMQPPALPAVASAAAEQAAAPAVAASTGAAVLAPAAAAVGAPADAAPAPASDAAAVPAAAGASAAAAGNPVDVVIDLLYQAADCAAAQAAGLTGELAASFGGAFIIMEDMQQRRHAQALVRLLQQGKHGMVAAHIRACLQWQRVPLPAAGAAGGGAAAAEASGEGSALG